MIILLLSQLAFADPITSFSPISISAHYDDHIYSGILVSEDTFTDYGRLKLHERTCDGDVAMLTRQLEEQNKLSDQTFSDARIAYLASNEALKKQYELMILDAQKRSFAEKNGYPVGVAVGFVAAFLLILGTGYAFGQIVE